MKVRELIRELRQWDDEAPVYLTGENSILWVQNPIPIALMNSGDRRSV